MSCLVLVVDDTAPCREVACSLVSALGYHAIAADCGASAIKVIKNAKPGDPFVLLTDYFLPDANGADLCRLVKTLIGGATLLCSGDPAVIDEFRETNGFVDTVLEKPYQIDELRAALECAVSQFFPLHANRSTD